MLALAGFRQRLAAPLRGRGGAMPRKGKAAGKEPAEPGAAAGPVLAASDGGVRVSVRAKPGSRCSAVTDVTAEAVGVAIAAPPSEGEANAELCRYLSKVLQVKKSDVILEKEGEIHLLKSQIHAKAAHVLYGKSIYWCCCYLEMCGLQYKYRWKNLCTTQSSSIPPSHLVKSGLMLCNCSEVDTSLTPLSSSCISQGPALSAELPPKHCEVSHRFPRC
uniref:BTB domain containing 1 n=1 Tax=Phasianus colchicus TaxID=9054 RepID=A0A669PVE4_PHACC